MRFPRRQRNRVRIPTAAAIELERLMHARQLADAEAVAFMRATAIAAGVDPARVVTIDTDHRVLVLRDPEQPSE